MRETGGIDRRRRSRVEIDARRLANPDLADLALGNERSQVHLGQVHERDDRRARHDDLARLSRPRGYRPCEGRNHLQILSVGPRFLKLRSSTLGISLGSGDIRLGLKDLSLHGLSLRRPDGRVHETRLGRRQRAASGLHLAARRLDNRRLSALVVLRPPCLLLGDQPALEESRRRVAVPLGLLVRGLGLGELGFGGSEPRLGLAHASPRVDLRLVHPQLVLTELLVQHGDLMLGQPNVRLGLPHGRLGLPLARADLLVVQHGDDLAGLEVIAFSHGDLADAPHGLGGDGRVVSLDPPAHRDDARRSADRRQAPDHEA